MIFSSLVFLCIFLPITYLIYQIMPGIKAKNGLLILVSLLFYAYGEPVYVLLMIASALINYVSGRLLSANRYKKCILVVNLILNFGILGIFKYAAFFIDTCNRVLNLTLSVPEISLPIGISFFTFQAVSYVLDVYSGKVDAEKSFWKVLLYISFFPQLIAGPIVKYRDISKQIADRMVDVNAAALGMQRFICGLAKKVLIANAMGEVTDHIFATDLQNINAMLAWLAAITYMLQIYYDFSGYSDMAIGLGKMFGFQFQENFCYPYSAGSIKEFWRGWHISLSTWFKEYVYIPLGGNRKGKFRSCFNRMFVFFLTGLWHGANWTFVLWGLWHGLFMIFEECIPAMKKFPKLISHIYTLLVVCVGFVMFRADNVTQGIYYIKQMFTGFTGSPMAKSIFLEQLTPYFIVMLVVGIIGTALVRPITEKIRGLYALGDELPIGKKAVTVGIRFASVILLLWCILRLSGGVYNPFIYFRF